MRKIWSPKKVKSKLDIYCRTPKGRRFLKYSALAVVLCAGFLFVLDVRMNNLYQSLASISVKDRTGLLIESYPNAKGDYAVYAESVPPRIAELLIEKEDRHFFEHTGINPWSILRAVGNYMKGGRASGSSTITQQLAKNILGNESERTVYNKIKELVYTFALEAFESKPRILLMYYNSLYLGNNIEGLAGAADFYFGKPAEALTDSEIIKLLASISNPSGANPWRAANRQAAITLAERLGVELDSKNSARKSASSYNHKSLTSFELGSLNQACKSSCTTTIDHTLTEKLRAILKENVDQNSYAGVKNGVILVIKEPENELLAMVGSPNPRSEVDGQSINMAIEPRPIGSTVKPFIYLRAFEKGLRPYTLVDDREYRYPIATGYPLYPKNYDGRYHGIVTLHQSLSNSYNVPSVKTLEYIGLPDFYDFLTQRLKFLPLVDLDSYQYGIALGGLEMDPLTLAHLYSIFPNEGKLQPLRLYFDDNDQFLATPMSEIGTTIQAASPKYVELVNRVLNDRLTGVEQFGLKSSLNLPSDNYAVKTGTSRDYHDSWTVGYTPDFLVVVWLGNAENTPLKELSGQSGAGTIWNQTMELLLNSEYNRGTPFSFDEIATIPIGDSLDFGLLDDVVAEHQNLLLEPKLILSPHQDDTVLFEQKTVIPLKASKTVSWYVNGGFLTTAPGAEFNPLKPGDYVITASTENKKETVSIKVIK